MPVSLGAKPDHGFDQPLGLLSDCHRRIEKFLGILARILDERSGQPLDGASAEAMRAALRYFEQAAPRHTADEEQSLFPRMRQSDDPRVVEAMRKLDELEADHDRADAAHAEVHVLGNRWLNAGALLPEDNRRMSELVSQLRALYQRHIAVEDNEIFPLAGEILKQQAIEEVGQEMATRRGLTGPQKTIVQATISRRADTATDD